MILVLVDHDRGELDPLSLRALTAARKLGQDIEAVVTGKDGAGVAGVVGELLTTIFSNHSPSFKDQMAGHDNLAVAFGQALQMTNILKDSPEDKARGVSWKPINVSQADLLKIAYEKLQDSLKYILLIPKQEQGMRRFCFLAFGLAVMTLSKIANRKEFDHKDEVKLSRNAVMSFYSFTKWAVKSDVLMKAFFYLSSRSLTN